jgi:predicted cupin superfamily sugar epimerase
MRRLFVSNDTRYIGGMVPRAAELIETLALVPHPEGGFYRQVYRSPHMVQPHDDRETRSALTAIYFLLARGQQSRWHRVRSDEIWTHLEGSPVTLHLFDGSIVSRVVVERMYVVPADVWQAAEPGGDYSLVACFVAPGFEFADFSMMSEEPDVVARLPAELRRLV